MRVRLWVSVVSIQLHSAAAMGVESAVPLDLRYEAPDDCPRSSAFSAAVARLVGNGPRVSRNVSASVIVKVDNNGGFVLNLRTELDGIAGERVLRGRSCDSVADAAVMTLALMLNPHAETNPAAERSAEAAPASLPAQTRLETSIGNSPPRTASAHPAPPTQRRGSQTEPAELRAANVPLRLVAGGGAGLDVGVMPHPSSELTLVGGVEYGSWSAIASLHYAPQEDVKLDPPVQNSAGGRLWHGSLMALACGALSPEPPRIGACAGTAYTRVQGRGIGVADIRHGATAWISPAAGLFGDLRLSRRVAVRASATLLAPANRPDTHLDGIGTVQRPGVLTAKLHAGVIIRFP